jgi:antitoxin ParD1/3/4
MDKATLTISLPRTMKEFIEAKLREGRFSTPSEYIRSLIRDDQDIAGNKELAVMIRRGVLAGGSPETLPARSSKPAARRRK